MRNIFIASILVLISVTHLTAGAARMMHEETSADDKAYREIKDRFSISTNEFTLKEPKALLAQLGMNNERLSLPQIKLALVNPEVSFPDLNYTHFKGQKNKSPMKISGSERIWNVYSLKSGVAISFRAKKSGTYVVNLLASAPETTHLFLTAMKKYEWGRKPSNAMFLRLGNGNYARKIKLKKDIHYILAINGDKAWTFHKVSLIAVE